LKVKTLYLGSDGMADSIHKVLNELLVVTFNDILQIEQSAIKEGMLKDLSVTEIHTIDAIGMYVPRTMSEVALDLSITVGTLTTAINNLVKKGYVERSKDDNDRRIVNIGLTKKGKVAFRVHQKFHLDMVKETIEGLSPEEEVVLANALYKLNDFFKSKYNLKK
jgi:DNA-binding MarR family transcriptional regulator